MGSSLPNNEVLTVSCILSTIIPFPTKNRQMQAQHLQILADSLSWRLAATHPANKLVINGPIEFSLDAGPGNHTQVWQQKRSTLKADIPHLSEKPGQTEGAASWAGRKRAPEPRTVPKTQEPHRGRRRGRRPSPERAAVERPETTRPCMRPCRSRGRKGLGGEVDGDRMGVLCVCVFLHVVLFKSQRRDSGAALPHRH